MSGLYTDPFAGQYPSSEPGTAACGGMGGASFSVVADSPALATAEFQPAPLAECSVKNN